MEHFHIPTFLSQNQSQVHSVSWAANRPKQCRFVTLLLPKNREVAEGENYDFGKPQNLHGSTKSMENIFSNAQI